MTLIWSHLIPDHERRMRAIAEMVRQEVERTTREGDRFSLVPRAVDTERERIARVFATKQPTKEVARNGRAR